MLPAVISASRPANNRFISLLRSGGLSIREGSAASEGDQAGDAAKVLCGFVEHFSVENQAHGAAAVQVDGFHAAQVQHALGAENASEIYFTSGGSESDNWAIKGAAFAQKSRGKHIITTQIEHHAVLHTCQWLSGQGFEITCLPVDSEGRVTPEQVRKAMRDDTILVSVMTANNEIGSIQPIKELCNIAHAHGALFHTDAVQAVGHINIDVNELGVDMLSASAHKFNGAKGVGFLYIRKGTPITAYADGGAQEHGLRAGTENVAGIVSMAIAIRKNVDNLKANQEHIIDLENMLINSLNESGIPYTRNGGDHTLPGIISLSFDGKDGEAILHRMDLMGICISTGSACDSKNTEISHVLQALRMQDSFAKGTIRISLGKDNTEEDVEAIVIALKKILL